MKNAVVVASIFYFAFAVFVLEECEFLAPYKTVLWSRYGPQIAVFSVVLFMNLVAGAYALNRKFAMKDTGDKLAHLEKQLRSNVTLSEELSRRIKEEDEGTGN